MPYKAETLKSYSFKRPWLKSFNFRLRLTLGQCKKFCRTVLYSFIFQNISYRLGQLCVTTLFSFLYIIPSIFILIFYISTFSYLQKLLYPWRENPARVGLLILKINKTLVFFLLGYGIYFIFQLSFINTCHNLIISCTAFSDNF